MKQIFLFCLSNMMLWWYKTVRSAMYLLVALGNRSHEGSLDIQVHHHEIQRCELFSMTRKEINNAKGAEFSSISWKTIGIRIEWVEFLLVVKTVRTHPFKEPNFPFKKIKFDKGIVFFFPSFKYNQSATIQSSRTINSTIWLYLLPEKCWLHIYKFIWYIEIIDILA